MSRKQNDVLLDCVDYAAELLRQGFTTVRDCGNPHYTAMAVRDGAERGLFRAPHILSCGYALAPTAPGNDDSAITVHADTPEEVLKAGRQQIACGADFLKYFGTGTVGSEHGVPGALLTTKPELQALNDTAEATANTRQFIVTARQGYCFAQRWGYTPSSTPLISMMSALNVS